MCNATRVAAGMQLIRTLLQFETLWTTTVLATFFGKRRFNSKVQGARSHAQRLHVCCHHTPPLPRPSPGRLSDVWGMSSPMWLYNPPIVFRTLKMQPRFRTPISSETYSHSRARSLEWSRSTRLHGTSAPLIRSASTPILQPPWLGSKLAPLQARLKAKKNEK